MRHKAGRCTGTSTSQSIFIMTPSLEGWPTKAKEASFPNEVRLTPLDTNPVFQCLGDKCHQLSETFLHRFICMLCEYSMHSDAGTYWKKE